MRLWMEMEMSREAASKVEAGSKRYLRSNLRLVLCAAGDERGCVCLIGAGRCRCSGRFGFWGVPSLPLAYCVVGRCRSMLCCWSWSWSFGGAGLLGEEGFRRG